MKNNLTEKDIETLNKFGLEINDKEKIFNIKKLNISNDEIKYIPTEFFKLINLEELFIYCRSLRKLPK
mgnify:FL=1